MMPSSEAYPVALELALAYMESLEDTEWLIVTRKQVKKGAHFSFHGCATGASTPQMIAYAMTQLETLAEQNKP